MSGSAFEIMTVFKERLSPFVTIRDNRPISLAGPTPHCSTASNSYRCATFLAHDLTLSPHRRWDLRQDRKVHTQRRLAPGWQRKLRSAFSHVYWM